MKVAIEKIERAGFFTKRWKDTAKKKNVNFIEVDFSSSDIIKKIDDCDIVFWHFSHASYPDFYLGKVLLPAISQKSLIFPTLEEVWHFDDKIAQKYLLESIKAPFIKTDVFYSLKDTKKFIDNTQYPIVVKLKGGAGSTNVKLLKSRTQAYLYALKSFSFGHRSIDRVSAFKFTVAKYMKNKVSFITLVKDFLKLFIHSSFERYSGRHKGYFLAQEFLPENKFDQRVVVIGNRAFAIIRYNNPNDFRASGTGNISFDKNLVDMQCVKLSFEVTKKLGSLCLAFDYLYDKNSNPLIAEISYGFHQDAYDHCTGYWDDNLNWHEGSFSPQEWIFDLLSTQVNL